ncbi:MAG: hypothetical protein ACRDNL_18675, partial [Spirillospora sp.]
MHPPGDPSSLPGICALPGCGESIPSTTGAGPSRRYCSPEHRTLARQLRREARPSSRPAPERPAAGTDVPPPPIPWAPPLPPEPPPETEPSPPKIRITLPT